MVRSFNAGVFSELMEARTDLDRYPASMRRMVNMIAAPQGPAIGRSGTMFVVPVANHAEESVLVPFVFSDEQAKLLEFAVDRIRFVDEDGIQVYAPVAFTIVDTSPFQVESATLNAAVGDDVVLQGYSSTSGLNGEIVRVTAKVGDLYTFTQPDVPVLNVNAQLALVYHVYMDYTIEQRNALRVVQSIDTVYLLTGSKPRKLLRYGAYDWRLEYLNIVDGPYLPINETVTAMTVSATGNAVPNMTDDTTPSGTCSGSGNHPGLSQPGDDGASDPVTNRRIYNALPASEFYYAFSANKEEYWASDTRQKGIIEYTPATPFIADGYVIYAAKANEDIEYLAKDYAPGTWTFEGWNGSTWTILDERIDYLAYDNAKSVFFRLPSNTVAYSKYRLNVTKLVRNGLIEVRIQRLVISSAAARTVTLTATHTTNINRNEGFKTTDVGRLVRLKGSDNTWRSAEITAVTNDKVASILLKDEPFLDLNTIRDWRLGYWSDTTGWPTCGDFFEDRFVLAGSVEYPDMFAFSVTGFYETFSQTDPLGVVQDDSAVVSRLNSRKLSSIRWLASDEKGLLIGTGSQEYLLSSVKGDVEVLTPRNIKARSSTSRGSANVEPVKIDRQVLYVQRSGRTLREMAFVYEADGYKSPSMSQLASHLGVKRFVELEYAAEPHGIVWVRREDGSIVGMTYNRDENVIGWHTHDFAGGVVESIAVVPAADRLQDTLWLVIRRTIRGNVRRYIERLTRFWDFDMGIDTAHYVDCALRYMGDPALTLYGLWHLEEQVVYGLADGKPVGPHTVTNGSITLDFEASNVVVGLGYDSEGETSRLDNGAEDGTAIGKVGRIHNVSALMWASAGGQVGTWDDQVIDPETGKLGKVMFNAVEYPHRGDLIEPIELYTGEVGPLIMGSMHEKKNSITFRRDKSSPLPFNIIALMPQMHKQDR